MISGNDNNERGNSGRSQSSSLNVGEIKKQIEKGMKEGLEKGVNKETFKNIKGSKPIKNLEEEIWKKVEEKEKMENKGVDDYQMKKSLREEFKDDQVRIKDISARQVAALKYKEEAEREAEKEVDKRLKEMGMQSRIKRKIASKVAAGTGKATSEMAYRIAQKMAEAANRGGIYAIVIILLTLFMALYTDVIDVLVEIFALIIAFLGIVSVVGIPIGVIIGAIGIIAWVSNFFVSLMIVFFWMFVLGGGHKKWFWKRLIRLVFALLVAESIPYLDLLPIATFMVCWNWYDFAKEKRKAKKDLAELETELYQTGRVSKKHAKNYANLS